MRGVIFFGLFRALGACDMNAERLFAEAPRHRMVSARISPMVELARWLLERQGLPYAEQPHAPMLHVIFTKLAGGGVEIPVCSWAEGLWDGGPDTIAELAKKSPPQARLFSDDPASGADERALVAFLFAHLLKQVRHLVYHRLLPFKPLIAPVVTEGAPLWERAFVSGLYDGWRALMAKGLDFDPALLAQAPIDIEAAFAAVEARLADGRRYLGGAAPNTVDIVFAALTAPVTFPDQYGALLPKRDQLPNDLRAYVDAHRSRPGGRLALDVYATARGTSQAPMRPGRTTRYKPPAFALRAGADALRRLAPNLSFRGARFVSRWSDLARIMSDDVSFVIVPVNAVRFKEVGAPFVLGTDRSERLMRQRRALYRALSAVDMGRVRNVISAESRLLLTNAAGGLKRIEVVNGYASLVAARAAAALFGVNGPSEPDLMRVARAIFGHAFLNANGAADIRDRGIKAGQELAAWIKAEMAARRAGAPIPADFLSALMTQAPQTGLSDDDIRHNVAGMLVGAIDTTAGCVANIAAEIGAERSLAARVSADLGDMDRLTGWCWEILRRRPSTPLIERVAVADAKVGGGVVKLGTKVIAVTLAAMRDPAAFPNPDRLDPMRPRDRYMHFGHGIHECAGRAINAFQIPTLVGNLLRFQPTRYGAPRMQGAFVDELVVTLAQEETAS